MAWGIQTPINRGPLMIGVGCMGVTGAALGRTLILQLKSFINIMKTSPSAKDVVLAQCVDVLRFKHYSLATV